jgi:hypothetical protein
VWTKITSKDDKDDKKKQKGNLPLSDDDMEFSTTESFISDSTLDMSISQSRESLSSSQSFLQNTDNSRLFDSMASIYGGELDPFEHLVVNEKDPKSKLERYDEIEAII